MEQINYFDSGIQQNSLNYYELYTRELTKVKELKKELEISKVQSQTYARELKNIYQHTKFKRKELSSTNLQLVKYASDLRKTISNLKRTHSELQEAYKDTIHRLVLASEYKDKDTGNHIARISRYCTLLAEFLGVSNQEINELSYAAPMHDVGKIGIPDRIILKKGRLTEKEFNILKTHTVIGAVILENSKAPILHTAKQIALYHHEKWNGTGYPHGLCKEEIPLMARIVALSDTFDALTSRRPYKPPYPINISCNIIKREREQSFDPQIVDIFLSNIDKFAEIKFEIDKNCENQIKQEFYWSERDLLKTFSKHSSTIPIDHPAR
ncbi:MAG: HD domain-containing protein [Fibrobacter sp.]|nr:HD domain-containing protein [Fibrobacter sp.]